MRALLLALLEVGAAGHRVDEVVGDIDALARAGDARRVRDVALEQLAPARGERRRLLAIAHETADTRATLDQRIGDTTADEPRRPRDERAQRPPVRDCGRVPGLAHRRSSRSGITLAYPAQPLISSDEVRSSSESTACAIRLQR